jgi:hypothetical protein
MVSFLCGRLSVLALAREYVRHEVYIVVKYHNK